MRIFRIGTITWRDLVGGLVAAAVAITGATALHAYHLEIGELAFPGLAQALTFAFFAGLVVLARRLPAVAAVAAVSIVASVLVSLVAFRRAAWGGPLFPQMYAGLGDLALYQALSPVVAASAAVLLCGAVCGARATPGRSRRET